MFRLKIEDENLYSNLGVLPGFFIENLAIAEPNFETKIPLLPEITVDFKEQHATSSENTDDAKVYECGRLEEGCKGEIGIQETYNVPEKKELNNANIIRNISFDQSEILWNIMKLHNEGNPFDCDMTASELKFYEGRGKDSKYNIPTPKILFDVYPQDERIQKIDKWGNLPLKDNSIHSIVIDLPFVISPALAPSTVNNKEGASLIVKRFAAYYPVDNLYLSYYNWIKNAYRVLDEGGICIFKCQNVISGGLYHSSEEFSFMAAQKCGFKMIDKFVLEAKARLISNSRYKDGQKHSRSYTSIFFVFKKEAKRKSKEFNYFDLLDRCEKEFQEHFVNVVEK